MKQPCNRAGQKNELALVSQDNFSVRLAPFLFFKITENKEGKGRKMILFLRFFAAFIYFIMATSMVSQLVDDEDFNKSAKPIIAVFAFMLVVGGVLLVKGGF